MNGLVDDYCKGCIHLEGDRVNWGAHKYCNYILDVGKSRPCPAGRGCTEYKLAGKRKTHRADPWDNWKYIKEEETGCD